MERREISFIIQLFGDFIHTADILLLLSWIVFYKSCSGISGKTQFLYALLFTCRYTDLFWGFTSYYTSVLKIAYILLAYLIVFLFYKFRKTYDYKKDSFWIEALILPLIVVAALVNREVLYSFSLYLEAVAIVPQLYMIYTTGQVENIVKLYILLLASYKCLYIAKWHVAGFIFDMFKLYAAYCQVGIYFLYFLIPKGKSKSASGHLHTNVLLRQKSFLLSPFAKDKSGQLETVSVIGQEVPPSIDIEKAGLEKEGKY